MKMSIKQSHDVIIIFIIVFGVAFLTAGTISGIVYLNERPKINEMKSFIASQYNFTESECIAWNEITITSTSLGITTCSDPSLPFYIQNVCQQLRQDSCSLYCRTLTVPDGEECIKGSCVNLSIYRNSIRSEEIEYCPSKVCMPVSRNIGQQCATAEQVQTARELYK